MRRWLLALMLLVTTGVVTAQETYNVPARALQSAGVDLRTFSIIHLSEDGHQVLGWDRPSVLLKKKGQKVRLWLLEFDSAFKLKNTKNYGMDLASLEQAQFTPEGQGVIIISRQGTEFYKLNLADGTLTTILSHTKGQPGFRSEPQILSWSEGRLLTVGYQYDANDVASETGVAFINPDATGAAAFTPGPAFGKVEQSVPGLKGSLTVSPRVMYFYGKQGLETTVYSFTPADGLKTIDKGEDVRGWWGEQTKFLYSLAKPGGASDLVLFDGNFGRRQVLASPSKPYESLSLSRDGATAIACDVSLKNATMNVYAFQEKNGWQPKEILKGYPVAVIRTAPDGNVVCFYDPSKGVTLVKL